MAAWGLPSGARMLQPRIFLTRGWYVSSERTKGRLDIVGVCLQTPEATRRLLLSTSWLLCGDQASLLLHHIAAIWHLIVANLCILPNRDKASACNAGTPAAGTNQHLVAISARH